MSTSDAFRPPLPWLNNTGLVIALGIVVLLSSMAIGSAATTMTEHGGSPDAFQFAGTTAKAEQVRADLGPDGRRAAWWFLGLELPFLVSYGLLLAAGCVYAATRLAGARADRLARLAGVAVFFGLAAAACDLIQNTALAFVLLGHTAQPAPGIAKYFGDLTWVLGVTAGAVFVFGSLFAQRKRKALAQT